MKKILLGFMLLTSFSLWAVEDDNQNCKAYCTSLVTCCAKKNIPLSDCEKQFEPCIKKYRGMPSNRCPEVKSCD